MDYFFTKKPSMMKSSRIYGLISSPRMAVISGGLQAVCIVSQVCPRSQRCCSYRLPCHLSRETFSLGTVGDTLGLHCIWYKSLQVIM